MMVSYADYEEALECLGIVSKFTLNDVKSQYLKLSKKYHPDMCDGNDEKFKEVNEAYKLIQNYIKSYRYGVNEDDFYEQNPFMKQSGDWFYNF